MSASVAHEIRNPLGIIKATADVLKGKYDRPDNPDDLFNYIGAEVQRLNNLVNDFLAFARESPLKLEAGSIGDTARKAVQAFQRDCGELNCPIELTVQPDLPDVHHDKEKIYQVLLNLLRNAAQATDVDGFISVTASHDTKGKTVLIRVTDTGTGIEGDVSEIFDPFYTTKSSGSGLGLAITRQIIEQHHGWIKVESTPGKGATFTIYLPVQ